jgi:predicted nuclease with TOPRIM domain
MSDQSQAITPATAPKPDEPARLSLPMIAERLTQMQIIFSESQEQLHEYIEEIQEEHNKQMEAHRQKIDELQNKLAKYEDLDARLKRVERFSADTMLAARR